LLWIFGLITILDTLVVSKLVAGFSGEVELIEIKNLFIV
jgi:hypothetical protein